MVIGRRNIVMVIGVVIIAGLGIIILIDGLQSAPTPRVSYNTPYGIMTIVSTLPETPDNLTLYKVSPQPNDMASFSIIHLEDVRPNTTSEADAPLVAQKSLEKYGGLPGDAVMSYDKTEYLDQLELSKIPFFPPTVKARYPVSTNVQYSRVINGHQISGDGGFINIELGNNGELLYIDKVWRTVTPSGIVPIISAKQALEKMQGGEILGTRPKCSCELTVNKIVPTYYEKGRNAPQDYLYPVWVFAGTLSDGSPWHYSVPAWQFANFNVTPGPTPLSIQFSDTSDSGPTKWFWDFGDGSTATGQSPVHSYKSAGVYNTTLTAWNDLGSDTVTKEINVRNSPGSSVLNSPSDTTSGNRETSNISN